MFRLKPSFYFSVYYPLSNLNYIMFRLKQKERGVKNENERNLNYIMFRLKLCF